MLPGARRAQPYRHRDTHVVRAQSQFASRRHATSPKVPRELRATGRHVVRDLGLGGAHAGSFPGMFACTGGSEIRAPAVPSTAGLEENAKALYQVLAPYERAATPGILHANVLKVSVSLPESVRETVLVRLYAGAQTSRRWTPGRNSRGTADVRSLRKPDHKSPIFVPKLHARALEAGT